MPQKSEISYEREMHAIYVVLNRPCIICLTYMQDPEALQGRYGFGVDNTIGGTPQPNGWMDNWVDFFRERRLAHQLKLAGSMESYIVQASIYWWVPSGVYAAGKLLLKESDIFKVQVCLDPCDLLNIE